MLTTVLYNIPDPPVDEADHAPGAVDTQCTSSVLRSHSDYESTIAGPSTLCIDAGFEQLNEAASSDENDEMDPDEVCLYEEIMRLMSTIDSKGNYIPCKSNVAAMAYLLAHSPRPMLCSHMAATSNMFCRICNADVRTSTFILFVAVDENEFKALAQMALFVLSPFLAPAEIEVWLALSKVLKFAYCDRVNPESMGYYETIVQNFVATAVVHGIFLLYGGSPKSTCFFIFLNICECLVQHLVITPKDVRATIR
ncbi:hypothetical protein EMCRGX_G018742 [Ephydatia muelleri]